MKKSVEKKRRAIRHNQCLATAAVVCTALACWAYGCQSQVESVKTPEKKVTRPELKIEVDTLLAEAKLKFEDLNRQDAFKRQLFEYATVVAEGSSVKPVGVAVSLFGILGIGAVTDNHLPTCCIKNDMRNLSLISTVLFRPCKMTPILRYECNLLSVNALRQKSP